MARRSRSLQTAQAALEAAERLAAFSNLPDDAPLRQQVLALAPVAFAVRDIGSSLLPGFASGRARILEYFLRHPATALSGPELFVIAGIDDWARRVRELRVELGWLIYSGATFRDLRQSDPEQLLEIENALGFSTSALGLDDYVMLSTRQDDAAAHRWGVLNRIRKLGSSFQDKALMLLRGNIGVPISGESFRYIAGDVNEWPRRLRELRTEQGWSVLTQMQGRPDIPLGSYLLESDEQAAVHDRGIPDPVRVAVLKRDGFACRVCGWNRGQLSPDDPRKFLELHHVEAHAKGGKNTVQNLITLCNVDHDAIHRGHLQLT